MPSSLNVCNPRTGAIDALIEPSNDEEITNVCVEVRKGLSKWQDMGVRGRNTALKRLSGLIVEDKDLLAGLVADTGREALSKMEVYGIAKLVHRLADEIEGFLEERVGTRKTKADNIEAKTQFVPYGVVGVISPWNFPLLLMMMDSVQALMAGCGVVAKPSEVTTRFIKPLTRIVNQVDGLRSVFRVIVGAGQAGAQLINNVDTVVFTGSIATGRKVAQAAALRMIPAHLELGGKDPAIVLPSADIVKTARTILRASVTATGQACQSIERIYVHKSKHDAFVSAIVDAAEKVELNDENISKGHIGPFIMRRQADIVEGQIADALKKGAKLHTGGKIITHGGRWMRPTVLTNVNHTMTVMKLETFGPVIPIMAYDSAEEAIQLANDSVYGLSGSVFGADETEAIEVGERMDVGAVSINNASLTGTVHEVGKDSFKLSGLGKSRMGQSGVARFFRKKALLINKKGAAEIDDFAEEETRSSRR